MNESKFPSNVTIWGSYSYPTLAVTFVNVINPFIHSIVFSPSISPSLSLETHRHNLPFQQPIFNTLLKDSNILLSVTHG